jgi:hydroxypyruvate reductase
MTLAVKQQAVAHVMKGGADITALNAVRKHLSRVKGGRLAAACPGTVVTFAISDVIGDDLSVIGSGPCVPDGSTWADAVAAVEHHGGWDGLPDDVRAVLDAGRRGALPDTPKPGDARLLRATAEVIGGRRQAMAGAAVAAVDRGYTPIVIEAPLTGEARLAAAAWWQAALAASAAAGRPVAVITSGETTVRVRGGGRGGRNQEFALALADVLAAHDASTVVASIGTDGIDGPTDGLAPSWNGVGGAGRHGRARCRTRARRQRQLSVARGRRRSRADRPDRHQRRRLAGAPHRSGLIRLGRGPPCRARARACVRSSPPPGTASCCGRSAGHGA